MQQRGRSASPTRGGARSRSRDAAGSRNRSNSRGPGPRPRSQSRQGRPEGTQNQQLKRGKRPGKQKGPGRRVRKAGGKVRKVGKSGYKGVKRGAKGGVRRFQKTNIGKRIAPEEKCGVGKFCSYVCAILLLLASSVGLVVATGNASVLTDAINDVIPSFDLGNLDDPFGGNTDPSKAIKWGIANPKAGLAIEVLNALDDSWGTTFQLAFADWEYGQPDALKLTEVKIDFEPDCAPANGKIKVCNSNYGEKPWRGIAECLIGSDNTYSSCVCKMNDYFLEGADLKQYTMCHEMGHGFGLLHTDEDFNNPDLGNCLDYTENYGFNKHPDEGNYETLVSWYGLASNRRYLRSSEDTTTAKPPKMHVIPESVERRRKEALAKLEASNYRNLHNDGWRMLHRRKHGEEHHLDLGEGFKLSVHMLLA